MIKFASQFFLCVAIGMVSAHFSFGQTDSISSWNYYPDHPRILLLAGGEEVIKKSIAADPVWRALHNVILDESDRLVKQLPVERVMTGRRLLAVSREALRRIFFLSYAWRLTGRDQYLKTAEKELLAVASFSDWNPSHFLDVAEMTMAVAIGYDWLFHRLSLQSKQKIRRSIMELGLKPSLEARYNGWLRSDNNWNQVCNAGITYGALAVYEDAPELSRSLINRAIVSLPVPMKVYGPDGAYPEGYSYWGYGTSFNVMFISAIEKLFQKDFGLSAIPGFMKTAGYLENMTGPTGIPFNYSDAGIRGGLQPAMFWFASRLSNTSLLWVERSRLQEANKSDLVKNRILPALMIWSAGLSVQPMNPPSELLWVGHGPTPVALMRTSWNDSNAIFLGMKGGTPSENHAHMDAGSFVMDADGERWAMDFGMQQYESLESKGLNIWGKTQEAQRWSVFRYVNQAHNTLTVNNNHQLVNGYAPIIASAHDPVFMHAVTDLTELYQGSLLTARRGVAIVNKQYVVIRDEIQTPDTVTTVRWNMLTPATARIVSQNEIELTQKDKKLIIRVETDAPITLKTWSTDPPNSWDASNTGTLFVGFEMTLPANKTAAVDVYLIPEKAVQLPRPAIPELSHWKNRSAGSVE